MGDYESAAMWDLYSPKGQGVAIQSTFARLRAAFDAAPETVWLGVVRYLDYDRDAPFWRYSFERFLAKRKSFEHERELRALTWRPPVGSQDWSSAPGFEKGGSYVAADLGVLVEALYVAPGTPDWQLEAVRSVALKYGRALDPSRSDLAKTPLY
jgi:hypothetical protein